MTDSASGPRPRRLTARGAATKARIIEAADQLMYERGVASTTLADVRASSGTSKSQLYQHFAEKDALVKEVIEARAEALLSQQRRRLTRVESLRGLELWRDELVPRQATLALLMVAARLMTLRSRGSVAWLLRQMM